LSSRKGGNILGNRKKLKKKPYPTCPAEVSTFSGREKCEERKKKNRRENEVTNQGEQGKDKGDSTITIYCFCIGRCSEKNSYP